MDASILKNFYFSNYFIYYMNIYYEGNLWIRNLGKYMIFHCQFWLENVRVILTFSPLFLNVVCIRDDVLQAT